MKYLDVFRFMIIQSIIITVGIIKTNNTANNLESLAKFNLTKILAADEKN